MKKSNTALFILIFCLVLGTAAPSLAAVEQAAVAEVNGVPITKTEYYKLLEDKYGVYALQELIERHLVNQKAEALQVELDEDAFSEIMEMILLQLGGVYGLERFLLENNITAEQFEDQIRWNALISELAKSEVEVDDQELEAWFLEHRHYFDEEESVEVSHILVDTQAEAEEILERLEAGEEFAQLAQEKSLDPGSAVQGGYLGPIVKGYTVAEFEELAFSLPVDEYGITESQFGWHIIWVQAKNEAEEAVFEEIYGGVLEAYRNTQAMDPQNYLMKLRMEADIDILVDFD